MRRLDQGREGASMGRRSGRMVPAASMSFELDQHERSTLGEAADVIAWSPAPRPHSAHTPSTAPPAFLVLSGAGSPSDDQGNTFVCLLRETERITEGEREREREDMWE